MRNGGRVGHAQFLDSLLQLLNQRFMTPELALSYRLLSVSHFQPGSVSYLLYGQAGDLFVEMNCRLVQFTDYLLEHC